MSTATEQLREHAANYQAKKAIRDNALDQAGIGRDIDSRMNLHSKAIAEFIGEVTAKCFSQSHHDLLVNVPTGTTSHWEATGEAAIRRAIPGICGAFVKWDINAAIELAADILDDVNAHGEAQKVRAMLIS